jgi:hypothetical protein
MEGHQMIDPKLLSSNVLDCIAQRKGFEEHQKVDGMWPEKFLVDVRTMSEAEAFEAWLEWNGIIGYTSPILRTLIEIKGAVVE